MEDKRNIHHNKSFNLPINNKDRKGLTLFYLNHIIKGNEKQKQMEDRNKGKENNEERKSNRSNWVGDSNYINSLFNIKIKEKT